ncbi:nuclear transport factor 2 family protein [Pseudoponticoccus marisrubri]|uniref:SnoaL-like domain-containing protein n=1 Tax=Pseudoponticoccus marisrubri TaxID=1685382 RepID=A0A0W7WM53_9RHOB|nr:nuclear transport factor 2 family protein [Pseudoponticoccus marisrubri]KUF11664.1 hypothetical protein AVJ23_07905 [Pseudoponticoccus marisrubri]
MAELTDIIAAYGAAWREGDAARRAGLLQIAWAEDGLYQDPTGEARGRDALVAHIGGFLEAYPGATLTLTSGIDLHHDRLRFGWRMTLGDGSVLTDGIDIGRVDPDGRLTEIIGFFGPLPAPA